MARTGGTRTADPLRRLTAGQWQPPLPATTAKASWDAAEEEPVAAAWARHAAAPGRGPATSPRQDGADDDVGPDPGRVATALTVPLPVVVGAVAVVLGAGGWWLWQQVAAPAASPTVLDAPVVAVPGAPASPVGASPGGVVPAGAAGGVTASTAPSASATVHVAGAVGAPGIVVVAPGSRVVDAVAAAGGLSEAADVTGVNLARPVTDGEMIVVPTPGQAVPPISGGVAPGSGAAAGTGPVDLNRASPDELESLPGVGPVLAGRIVRYREDTGPFTTVDDLTAVPGIGPAILEGLRDLATV